MIDWLVIRAIPLGWTLILVIGVPTFLAMCEWLTNRGGPDR